MSTVEDIQAAVLSELTAIAPEVDPEELEATVLLRDQVDLDSMDWLNFLQRVHKRFKVDIPEKDVGIVTIGADMSPLLTGQVDAITGWLTNTTALKVLGTDRVDLRLWDTGVRLYALPYYATAKTIETKGDVLAAFLRATGHEPMIVDLPTPPDDGQNG